jgi:hypothetical protein
MLVLGLQLVSVVCCARLAGFVAGAGWLLSLGQRLGRVGLHSQDLAGFADSLAARPLLVALWLHEALDGWPTLPAPTRAAEPFPKLRELYEHGQRQGVFRADCPFEVACGVAMNALVGSAVLAPRGAKVLKRAGLDADPARLRDQVVG